MTLNDLMKLISSENDIWFEVIAEDGRQFALESINGKYYDNLDNCNYWVDEDYSTDETEDGEDIISSYDVLLKTEELFELEIAEIKLDEFCNTIVLRK